MKTFIIVVIMTLVGTMKGMEEQECKCEKINNKPIRLLELVNAILDIDSTEDAKKEYFNEAENCLPVIPLDIKNGYGDTAEDIINKRLKEFENELQICDSLDDYSCRKLTCYKNGIMIANMIQQERARRQPAENSQTQ